MGKTSIEWTATYHPDGTVSPGFAVNPILARLKAAAEAGRTKGGYDSGVGHYCEMCSPGCARCYSSTTQPRFGMPQFPGTNKRLPTLPLLDARGGILVAGGSVEVFFEEAKLRAVLSRKKPAKWFWCDMTDLFGSWVPDEWIDRCFAVMALTPHHTHQVLTKRPKRMAEYLLHPGRAERIYGDWYVEMRDRGPGAAARRKQWFEELGSTDSNYDPSHVLARRNVWLGTSVEDRPHTSRIDDLRAVPAAVRFLSIEPLLEDVGTLDLTGIHWVIVGGESGHGSRPMHPDWARSLRDQCQAAGVAFFFKQWGEWSPLNSHGDPSQGGHGPGQEIDLDNTTSARRTGKKVAGRRLDGRTWDEFPTFAATMARA